MTSIALRQVFLFIRDNARMFIVQVYIINVRKSVSQQCASLLPTSESKFRRCLHDSPFSKGFQILIVSVADPDPESRIRDPLPF
jgi:hypothetical protein